MDDHPHPADAELNQPIAMLTGAGLIELYVDDDGHEAHRLTHGGQDQ